MFKYMSIRSKLVLLMLIVGLTSAAAVGILSYNNSKTALTATIYDQLTALRETKKRQTLDYFDAQITAFEVFSNQQQLSEALDAFSQGFDEKSGDIATEHLDELKAFYLEDYLPKLARNSQGEPVLDVYFPHRAATQALQIKYIAQNPADTGAKDSLVQAKVLGGGTNDASTYGAAHARFHPLLRRMQQRLFYYDVFLINPQTGDIVYSVFKEADFATNLNDGPYRYTGLAKAFEAVRNNPQRGKIVLVDFDHYAPSYNAPAAFMATPVFDGAVLKGIVAAQLNIDDLNRFMTSDGNWAQEGLGASGEVYLVGEDNTLRTSSRFLIEDKPGYIAALKDANVPEASIKLIENTGVAILNQPVNSVAANEALRGQSGSQIIKDYRNVDVLSSYGPIEVAGKRWAILAEKDVAEAMKPLHDLRNRLMVTLASIAILVTLFSTIAAGLFAKPVAKLEASVARFKGGDRDFQIDASGTDEFASLSGAFNGMIEEIRGHTAIVENKNKENERLLRTVLPDIIADRVRGGDETIAETFESVTVVYAAIGRFSEIMANLSASEMINMINELIGAFDEAAERHGVERINTVGDVYLAACGLPVPRLDHAKRAAAYALEMLSIVHRFNRTHGFKLTLSVGLSSGEVDAGIVGKRRFVYEILGESVTIARQLASETAVNTVSIAQSTYDDLPNKDSFIEAKPVQSDALGRLKRWVSQTPGVIEKKDKA